MSNSLYAGFARVDITPKTGGIPLAGYGSTKFRLASNILDRLYLNTVAVGQNGKAECVMITADLINIGDPYYTTYREKAAAATGLPVDRIYIGGTHTHSGPDMHSTLEPLVAYRDEYLPDLFAEAAARAVADLKPAKLSYGRTEVGRPGMRLNFNRYYYMVPIEKKDCYTEEDLIPVGDNYGDQYARDKEHYCYVGHEEEPDPEMMLIKFTREAADDILFVNYTAHATITGGLKKPDLSSDYPGALVKRVEELFPGTKCIYWQGCAGNTNPRTRMQEEGIPGLTWGLARSHYAYAAALAGYVWSVISGNHLQESGSDTIAFSKRVQVGNRDHSGDSRVEDAQKIADVYLETGYTDEVRHMVWEAGFNSPYHCTAILRKAKAPMTSEITLNAVRIGDVAITFAPFELFSGTGKHIKANSPFPFTVVKAYSCGSWSYLPSINSYPNSYEANQTSFERGTAEILEGVYQEMLEELHNA